MEDVEKRVRRAVTDVAYSCSVKILDREESFAKMLMIGKVDQEEKKKSNSTTWNK